MRGDSRYLADRRKNEQGLCHCLCLMARGETTPNACLAHIMTTWAREGTHVVRIPLASGDFGTSPFFGQLFSQGNLLDDIAAYHSFKA
jgi:hypothetical protein